MVLKLPKELREKKEMGVKENSEKICSVKDCGQPAIRSLSEDKYTTYVESLNLNLEENKQHKIYLCKEHYKEVSKKRKTDDKLIQKKGFLTNDPKSKRGKNIDFSD